ncbi:Gfo/Idh/MocA family protein [Nonomuraea aurantiaca]|uniref:Gfo/Idh/MocA family protein n=1 Tax=Nonomuraea aurantiaca TaxID=2878562 RepID=UPI001CD9A773|nr:Gfo/Idh/MocA family oxidoreductase [Nonomuraea aurantiaca]MCA2226973.1 Gfo/Idh/MocA family oxidoreductase [Nonomuraea aurantiaca]
MSAPVNVGLVGAGPWARDFHAPVFAAGPETRLAGVWSRRAPAARALAERFGVPAFTSYERLLERCEAVVFAVPPDVQAAMAVQAARRGRALLLEKPIALTVRDAQALADAVDATGVATQLVLTNRYRPAVREFLKQARDFPAIGARAMQLTGEFLDDTFADSPWRSRAGVLYNTGPHGLDLLDAALGRITEIRPTGNRAGFLALTCLHENEVISQLTICGRVPQRRRTRYELYGPEGTLVLDSELLPEDSTETRATLRAEFATAVRMGRSHELDVHRGLHLQRLLAQAEPR